MISILEDGHKKTIKQKVSETFYKKKCSNCGCKFLYQAYDIEFYGIPVQCEYVRCPQCEELNSIFFKKKYKRKYKNK